MPDFEVVPTLAPSGAPIVPAVWADPPSPIRPSRIAPLGDRQHRFIKLAPGNTLQLDAKLHTQSTPQPDTTVGGFTAWCIECPNGGTPAKSYPVAGQSSTVRWKVQVIGHYLFAMRHEDTRDAPYAAAGGVVLVHCDVIGS